MTGYTLSDRAVQTRDVDVLVLGGGMSGVFSAIGAKDETTSVVIVEPANVLGGQGTSGGVAGFVGDTENVNDAFRTLIERLALCGKIDPYRPNEDRRAYDLESCAFILQELVDEAGIEIWLHSTALDMRKEGADVREVLVRCGPNLVVVRPKMVIDATGNAVIATISGCETIHLGPRKQLPMSLYFTLWNTGKPVEPYLPPGCPLWESSDDLPMTSLHAFSNGRVEVKMKVVGFDAADGFSLSRAEIYARRQMMGLIYHLQTQGYQGRHSFDGGRPLATYTLASVSRNIGQREGRRIIGRSKLTDDDVRSACTFSDAVAVGAYHLDFHWTDTEKRAGTGVTDMVEPYQIPLSAMRPVGLNNVLCPGRSLSGDQLALSSYRAMTTCAQMGFGAGKAAVHAISRSGTLDTIDFEVLKKTLAENGQSLNLSDYGDYLRCLRVFDESVPFAGRSETNSEGRLILARASGGRTLALRHNAQAGRMEIALRRGGGWQPKVELEASADAGHLVSCAFGGDGGLVLNFENSQQRTFVAEMPVADLDDGKAFSVPVGSIGGVPSTDDLDQVRFSLICDAEGFPVSASASDHEGPAAVDGMSVLSLASCPFGPGRAHLVAGRDGVRDLMLVLIVEGETKTISRYLLVDRNADAGTRPAIIPTAVGLALLYQRQDGEVRFYEGAVERFAAVGERPPREEDLQAMPYNDHVIFSTL
ncbi:FAD-dependent oxidoreductase [Martelella sp. AD-3]|uniref:FAD-dependent oxidoreductase n=1 Tax=Martelella sp. AD-3 TaxID=686597 RepID=UPI0004637449|nr:FAD-dependent oxidoreductase [Martelella sp. AD-3]AMM84044.1 hypothetical protein AZF01_06450 [Martelella sp. AD-3]